MNKQQLANRIWASANRMRSKIDANEYQDYILGLIFYKFLSDNDEANLLWLTKDKIENLSDNEVNSFLRKKWIDPICYGIVKTLLDALTGFEKEVCYLTKKYETSYTAVNQRLGESQDELSFVVGELTGDDFALKGLMELVRKDDVR